MSALVEKVAVALWRQDAERAAPNILKHRTLEAFRSGLNETDRAVWEGFARTAIAVVVGTRKLTAPLSWEDFDK